MPKQQLSLDVMLEKYMPFFSQFEMEEANLRSHFEHWSMNRPPIVADYMWYIFNKLLSEIAIAGLSEAQMYDYHWQIYFKMWEFRIKDEGRKDNGLHNIVCETSLRRDNASSNLKLQAVLISGHCCPYCDGLNGKVYELEEVFEQQPLKGNKCTREWGCNCVYSTIPVRDANGRLIRK